MYAVINIPRFALQAVLRLEEGLSRRPVALVDGSLAKPAVIDCTRAAERSGVLPGLSLPQAIARCEEVAVRYCSAKAEALAGRALFDCAYSLSPRVEESGPGVCSIGLAGVNRTGLAERCEEMVSDLKGLGLAGRMGIAPTPDLALLAAAGPSEGLATVLDQWGIRTAGAFADLSREEVGKRLGMEGLAFWDRISGREERPLRISELPEVYEESLEFEYEIDILEPLLFVIRRFLEPLCLRLKGAAMVADSVHLRLDLADIRMEDGERIEALEFSLKIPDPTRDSDALFLIISTRLEEVDTESAVVGIRLKIDPIDRNESQLGLFETSLKDPHRFTQTLARVAGIVGAEKVGCPRVSADGRPDGFVLERLPTVAPPMRGGGVSDHFGLALRRFRPPLDADVRVWERRPVWVRCDQASGAIACCYGPWAHSGQWWEPGGWNRLEWDVELQGGGVYRLVKESTGWQVEGFYD